MQKACVEVSIWDYSWIITLTANEWLKNNSMKGVWWEEGMQLQSILLQMGGGLCLKIVKNVLIARDFILFIP